MVDTVVLSCMVHSLLTDLHIRQQRRSILGSRNFDLGAQDIIPITSMKPLPLPSARHEGRGRGLQVTCALLTLSSPLLSSPPLPPLTPCPRTP